MSIKARVNRTYPARLFFAVGAPIAAALVTERVLVLLPMLLGK